MKGESQSSARQAWLNQASNTADFNQPSTSLAPKQGKAGNTDTSKWAPGPESAKTAGLFDGVLGFVSQMTSHKSHTKGTFKGHKKPIAFLRLGQDNKYVLSASDDRTIRYWHRETGECVVKFDTETTAPIQDLEFIPNNMGHAYSFSSKTPMSEPGKGVLCVWNLVGEYPIGRLDITNRFAFSRQGKKIAFASDDFMAVHVKLYQGQWNTTTLMGHETPISCITFSSDCQFIMAGAEDGSIRFWDIESRQELCQFIGHTDRVQELVISPDGRWMASSSNDGTVRIWDAYTGTAMLVLDEFHPHVPVKPIWSKEHNQLLTVERKTIRLWDLGEQKTIARFTPRNNRDITAYSFIEDTNHLLVACQGEALISWIDMVSGDLIDEFDFCKTELRDLLYVPDSDEFLSAGNENHFCKWSLERQQ
ncbi:MAG: hypothetical protein KC476_07760 [Cyanobacteria bacterium HKST-UBA06]|nr:hypothetical protein [Cyanobacteria bacterium HKST-UBA06]